MPGKAERKCRMCKKDIKGKNLYLVHKRLCNGTDSTYSVILSNVNNYERPGRQRCSQHHRYRPSADRPRRSKSVPPTAGGRGRVLSHFASSGVGSAGSSMQRCTRTNNNTPSARKSLPAPHGDSTTPPPSPPPPPPSSSSKGDGSGTKSVPNSPSRAVGWSLSMRIKTSPKTPPVGGAFADVEPLGGGTTQGKGQPCGTSTEISGSVCAASEPGQLTVMAAGIGKSEVQSSDGSTAGTEDGDPPALEGGSGPEGRRMASRCLFSPDKAVNRVPSLPSAVNTSKSSAGLAQNLVPLSIDAVEASRLGIDNYKPFFFNSESVPSSLEVSRRRVHSGKRGYFCCEIGCSCRKCHYFTLSLVKGRQSSFLRRCDAVCPCKKCHLQGKTKSSNQAVVPSPRRRSGESNELEQQSTSLPNSNGHWHLRESTTGWRSSGRRRRAPSQSPAEERSNGAQRKEEGESSEKRGAGSETDGDSPKRRRERKEVLYRCLPCAKELHAWSNIRKHLMSSEHLHRSVKDMRKVPSRRGGGGVASTVVRRSGRRGCECEATMTTSEESTESTESGSHSPKEQQVDGVFCQNGVGGLEPHVASHGSDCSVPAVPTAVGGGESETKDVALGNGVGRAVEQEVGAETDDGSSLLDSQDGSPAREVDGPRLNASCPVDVSSRARQGVNLSLEAMKLMLRPTPKPSPVPKPSTFIRVDYNKKKAPSFGSSPGSAQSEESAQRACFECARVEGDVYNCTRVESERLPRPYVNMGKRCDSVGFRRGLAEKTTEQMARKMIRMDYCRKPAQSSAVGGLPSFGNLTYLGVRGEGEAPRRVGNCSSPSSASIESLVDEGALGERLFLSDSSEEDEGEVGVATVQGGEEEEEGGRKKRAMQNGMEQDGEMESDQVVILDSQRFLSCLVRRLNDGGLSCHCCGSSIDGNSIVTQLYNLSPKSHASGGDATHSFEECTEESPERKESVAKEESNEDESTWARESTRGRRTVKQPRYLDDYETAWELQADSFVKGVPEGRLKILAQGRKRKSASMLLMRKCVL